MVRVKLCFGFMVLGLVAISGLSFASCAGIERPEGALSCCECLENPAYDTEAKIYGQVSSLGELLCPCFLLTSGGKEILVWYDSMVEDDGTERPSVSIEGIKNDGRVIVTGELKTAGEHRSLNDFWASSIEEY